MSPYHSHHSPKIKPPHHTKITKKPISFTSNKTKSMLAIGNDELNELPQVPPDVTSFEIIHTNPDGSTETCTVKQGKSPTGLTTWNIGAYTTKSGTTYLAVLMGKLMEGIQLK
jgi:hypothetical protein